MLPICPDRREDFNTKDVKNARRMHEAAELRVVCRRGAKPEVLAPRIVTMNFVHSSWFFTSFVLKTYSG
jgi:hypothetical protein